MVLLLIGAYRSLGAPPLRAADAEVLLTALHASVRASVDKLSGAMSPTNAATPDAARDARRTAASAQQILDRLPPAVELDHRDAAACALLAAAVEDLGWGWRMWQSGAENPGVSAAVTSLVHHAADCCDQALELLVRAPVGEPPDRP